MAMVNTTIGMHVNLICVVIIIETWSPAYDEDDSEDDKYEENIHGGYRSLVRERAHDNQEYCMKMELPHFNEDVTIKVFLDWVIEVERFFAYMENLEGK